MGVTNSKKTNYELDRLFSLSASPATAAALRFGGAPAAAAVARLRQQTMERRNNSDGFLQNWDAHGSSDVVTVATGPYRRHTPSLTEDQRSRRASSALAELPVERLASKIDGDPCAICQDFMEQGEEVRRLPCAHIFHASCIARWLHVKLTCPLDNLPVDEGLEMLAASATVDVDDEPVPDVGEADGSSSVITNAAASVSFVASVATLSATPPPPPSAPPPEVDCNLPPPPPSPPRLSPLAEEARRALRSEPAVAPPPSDCLHRRPRSECLAPVGLEELQAAAADAGVTVERMAEALAERRAEKLQPPLLE